jgi:hypothetical protein
MTSCGCGKKNGGCKCGCDCRQDGCCAIECLERPRFFCGQLLTDQDFNKLAEWIDVKGSLQRFLHGWGVVCGLDVSIDPCDCTCLCISPGYAIDCCGRDLVVCDPLCLSLKDKYCTDPEDPCAMLGRPPAQTTGSSAPVPQAIPDTDLGGVSIKGDELTLIDLYLRYGEQLGRPQRQPSSSSCAAEMDSCQYTRVTQVPEICTKTAPLTQTAPGEDLYKTQLKAIFTDLNKQENMRDADALDRYLAGAFKRNYGGLHRFSFISQLSRSHWDLPRLAYWIIQDWYLWYAAKCPECDDSTGVPVARVYLRKYQQDGKKKCCIVYVEQMPPFRRWLSQSGRLGTTSLVPHLWSRVDAARPTLTRIGVPVKPFDTAVPGFAEVQGEFERASFWASPNTPMTARSVLFQGQERIALFQRENP